MAGQVGKERSFIGINFWSVMVTAAVLGCLLWNWTLTLLIAILAITIIYLFVILIMTLAKENIFLTIVEEGQAKGITIFNRAHKCLMAYTAHRFEGELDPEAHLHEDSFWDIRKLRNTDKRPEEKRFWHRFVRHALFLDLGGLKWIGLWPFYQVHKYKFRWTSLRGQLPTGYTDQGTKYEQTREETIDYILIQQATYLLNLTGIEDTDQLSIDVKLVWTTQIVNPFKALFRVRNWLETSADRLLTHIRRSFAASTWRDFQSREGITQILEPILQDLKELYGVETVGIEVIELNPPAEFQQAAEKIRMAQADVVAASHEAEAARIRSAGEADRIKNVMGTAMGLGTAAVVMKVAEDVAKGLTGRKES